MYIHKLLSEEGGIEIVMGELEHLERHRDFGYCRCIEVEDVKCATKKMSK